MNLYGDHDNMIRCELDVACMSIASTPQNLMSDNSGVVLSNSSSSNLAAITKRSSLLTNQNPGNGQ